jgi:hypothetical protein
MTVRISRPQRLTVSMITSTPRRQRGVATWFRSRHKLLRLLTLTGCLSAAIIPVSLGAWSSTASAYCDGIWNPQTYIHGDAREWTASGTCNGNGTYSGYGRDDAPGNGVCIIVYARPAYTWTTYVATCLFTSVAFNWYDSDARAGMQLCSGTSCTSEFINYGY